MPTQNDKHRPPPYELFFAPLEISLTPNELEAVQFAYQASKHGHKLQVRSDGSRYFDHPKAAAWIYIHELGGRDADTIIIILLHDMGEDSHLLTPRRLMINFNVDTARSLRGLTKLPKGKELESQYLGRVIAEGEKAIIAKLRDRLHNLRTVGDCDREKQHEQLAETREFHLQLLIPALKDCGDEWKPIAELLECKIQRELAYIEKRLSETA